VFDRGHETPSVQQDLARRLEQGGALSRGRSVCPAAAAAFFAALLHRISQSGQSSRGRHLKTRNAMQRISKPGLGASPCLSRVGSAAPTKAKCPPADVRHRAMPKLVG